MRPPSNAKTDEFDFIRTFIKRPRRERYSGLLQSKNGRTKLRKKWAHCEDFDERSKVLIPPRLHTPENIAEELRKRGAGKFCSILSEDEDLDAQSMELEKALQHIVGMQVGTVLICIPDFLGYYESEERDRYILQKNA